MKSSNIRTFPMFNVPLVTIPIFKRPMNPPRHQMNPYRRFSPYPQPIATKPQLNPQSMYPKPIPPKTQLNLQPMYPQPIAPKTQLNIQQLCPPKTQQKYPMNIEPIQKIQLNPQQKNPSKSNQNPQQKYLPKPHLNPQQKYPPKSQLNPQQKNLPKTQPKRAGIRGGPGMDSQQQQYCLKWNSFGSNLATSFANLWNSESLADVTLYCEGRTFKAHKVILAACSKHFQELFDTAPPSHAGACYVILEATSADNMQALLEFMYKGEVHVSQDALSSFLKSGENLQVKGLSMEMSNDAWVKQQTQQSNDRHPTRIKTSPVSGSGNCEAQEATSHTATFAPIIPTYGIHGIHGSGSMGRYAPPAHVPLHPTAHRRPAQPKPSPSQSPHPRNYRQSSSSSHCGSVAEEPDTRSSPGAGQRFEDNNPDCTSTLGNPVKNNGYERSGSATDDMIERLPNDQGAEDLRVKSENDYHQSGYNNSPPPAAIPTTNYHEKPLATSPVPPKPTPDIWPTKIITSKSGGIATADGKKLKCPYCERLYGYETNLRAHIRQRHQGIRVPCPHCSRTFTRNNTVRRHIAREHRHQVTPHTPHTPHAHSTHATHAPLHAAQPPLSNHTQ